jgi:hypothetical protein
MVRVWLAAAVVLVGASGAVGKLPPPVTPPAVRAAEADLVVVGEVTKIGPMVAVVEPTADGQEITRSYTTAEVTVNTVLVGDAKRKAVKVGFHPKKPEEVEKDGYTLQLAAKDVKCLFLKPHPSADFYIESGHGEPLDPAKKDHQPWLEQVKKVAAVLADPEKALKAEKADDRVFAALCLAYNYAPVDKDGYTAEDLTKEQSDLILKALRDADPEKLERADGFFWVAAVERFGLAKGERLGQWFGERGKDRSAKRFKLYAEWYDKPGTGERPRLQYWVKR